MNTKLTIFGAAIFVVSISVANVFSQTLPFRYKQDYLTGFSSPIFLTNAKDGTRRLFIVEQGGIIKVVQPGSTTATIFMNITARVLSGGERGLLGLAFHPNFENNHYFFVYYTQQTDGQTKVSRFTATNNNSVGNPNSERVVLGPMEQPFSNHNGGMIEFREDNPGVHNLYIAKGDGGSGNDPGNRAQNIDVILGKILRITPDVSGNDANPPYTNPNDNPYVGVTGLDEIYAIGMRNPWRFSFDRGGTNQLWVGDVGQSGSSSWEEVDIITRGANYGWKVCEGFHLAGSATLCNNPAFTDPIFEYSSASPSQRCSITGGYVYRGGQRALPQGSYVYGDLCTGEVLMWNGSSETLLVDTSRSIVSFGEDEDGELYVVGHGGSIDKMLGNRTSADFDGDLKVDRSVFRPSNSSWFTALSSNGQFVSQPFGIAGDIPAPEDFDGDGKADLSVFRPGDGTWHSFLSSNSTYISSQWGLIGDIAQPGDFDADGKADHAVYRGSSGTWHVRQSTNGLETTTFWGLNGDIPVASDYDGDGRFDVMLWRPSDRTWYGLQSTNGNWIVREWGLTGDIPTQGDFDGDGKSDLAIYRPSVGQWHILRSSNGGMDVNYWGLNGDIPVAGDYDGDAIDDVAVFRQSDGVWYIIGSTIGEFISQPWGLPNDLPVPKYDAP